MSAKRRRTPDSRGYYQCSKCKEYLPRGAFYENDQTSVGLSSWCKPCTRENQKRYNPAAKRRELEETNARLEERLRRYEVQLLQPPGSDPVAIRPLDDEDEDLSIDIPQEVLDALKSPRSGM